MYSSIQDFSAALAPKTRIMALDAGTKTLGIAISDSDRRIANPVVILTRDKLANNILQMRNLIGKQAVGGIVIGWPLNMDGSEGPRCQATRALARELNRAFNLPILLWDERLSTVAVERTMLDANLSRERRKQVVDKMAACFILQGVLDAMGFHNNTAEPEAK